MLRIPLMIIILSMCFDSASADNSTSDEANGASVKIEVSGINVISGRIDCALFSSDVGFLQQPDMAAHDIQQVTKSKTSCSFTRLKAGNYAIAISHDLNSNGKLDKNFFGVPKEPWGVSNNARPKMRAPKFKEAMFELADRQQLILEIMVK